MDRYFRGDIETDDQSATIQAFIDWAEAQGADGLRLPSDAEITAAGLIVPSGFGLDGRGSKLTHPDGEGTTAQYGARFRTHTGTGSVDTAGALTGVTVPNGALVQVLAAGPVVRSQVSTLAANIGITLATITVTDQGGWDTTDGVILIEDELIEYTTYDEAGTFTGCIRGAFGTTAVAHTAGDPLSLAGDLYAVHRNDTLDPTPERAVTGAAVWWGSQASNICNLTLDGQRDIKVDALPNTYGVDMDLARGCSLDHLDIYDFDHAGVYFQHGARENVVSPTVTIRDIGSIAFRTDNTATAGACVWVFAGSSHNQINPRLTGEWQNGVFMDDRSVKAKTADQVPIGNRIDIVADCTPLNAAEVPIGVTFGGFVDQATVAADVTGCDRGISIAGSGQGPVTGFGSLFDVRGKFRNCDVGVFVAAVAENGHIGPVLADATVTTAVSNSSTTTTDVNS